MRTLVSFLLVFCCAIAGAAEGQHNAPPCDILDRLHAMVKQCENQDMDTRDAKVAQKILAELKREFPDMDGWVCRRDPVTGESSFTLIMPDDYVYVVRYGGFDPVTQWVVVATGQKYLIA
jgi:hypothetical protein